MSRLKKEIENIKQRRHEAVKEACLIIEADAKLLAPVKTGTLKRSITHDVKSDDKKTIGAVGSNVEYAYWAERNKPYLEPSLNKNLEFIKRRIAEILKGDA